MQRNNALETLNLMVIHHTKELPYGRKTRLAVMSRISGYDVKASTREIPPNVINELLEIYFPNWQIEGSLPPEDSQSTLREIAVQCSQQLVEELGDFDEYIAKLRTAEYARHEAKEAAKAERIRKYEEQQRLKKERQAKKKAQTKPLPVLPTERKRRIFG